MRVIQWFNRSQTILKHIGKLLSPLAPWPASKVYSAAMLSSTGFELPALPSLPYVAHMTHLA